MTIGTADASIRELRPDRKWCGSARLRAWPGESYGSITGDTRGRTRVIPFGRMF